MFYILISENDPRYTDSVQRYSAGEVHEIYKADAAKLIAGEPVRRGTSIHVNMQAAAKAIADAARG